MSDNFTTSERLQRLVASLEAGDTATALTLAREARDEHASRVDAQKARDLPKAVRSFCAWWRLYQEGNRHISVSDVSTQVERLAEAWRSEIGDPTAVPRAGYVERETCFGAGHLPETRETHESFGMIQVNRVQGRGRLFGSSVDHQGFFQVSIFRGERVSSEWGERFLPSSLTPIVQVSLSPAQFVEVITTQNQGGGIPCTIDAVEGVRLDPPPSDMENELQKIRKAFRKRLTEGFEELDQGLATLEEHLGKKTLTKADRDAIRSIVLKLARLLKEGAPHTLKMFSEATERHIVKGKQELESYVETMLQSLPAHERSLLFPDIAQSLALPESTDEDPA